MSARRSVMSLVALLLAMEPALHAESSESLDLRWQLARSGSGVSDAVVGTNGAQGTTLTVGDRGATFSRPGAGWSLQFELGAIGVGGRYERTTSGRVRLDGDRVEIDRGAAISERFMQSPTGVTQQIVLSPTLAGANRLVWQAYGLKPALSAGGQALEFVTTDNQVVARQRLARVFDATGRALRATYRLDPANLQATTLQFDTTDATFPVTMELMLSTVAAQ